MQENKVIYDQMRVIDVPFEWMAIYVHMSKGFGVLALCSTIVSPENQGTRYQKYQRHSNNLSGGVCRLAGSWRVVDLM